MPSEHAHFTTAFDVALRGGPLPPGVTGPEAEELPGIPVSISSHVLPEMR